MNNDGFILGIMMTELITENELETKVKSYRGKSTDKIIVSATQRGEKWFLSITHNQKIENIEHKHQYKIKIRDENKEKSYGSLDILANDLERLV